MAVCEKPIAGDWQLSARESFRWCGVNGLEVRGGWSDREVTRFRERGPCALTFFAHRSSPAAPAGTTP
jgi:hypothetical protein